MSIEHAPGIEVSATENERAATPELEDTQARAIEAIGALATRLNLAVDTTHHWVEYVSELTSHLSENEQSRVADVITQLIPPEVEAEELHPLNFRAQLYIDKMTGGTSSGKHIEGLHEEDTALIASVIDHMRREVVQHNSNYGRNGTDVVMYDIIKRYLNGEGNTAIAADLGLSKNQISMRISWTWRAIHDRYGEQAAEAFRELLEAYRQAQETANPL